MRLIDAEVLEKAMYEPMFYGDGRAAATHYANCVRNAPTIEAEPVKYGHWVYGEFDVPHCSECGAKPKEISPYCSGCGAKMDGGEEST